jgi:DNA-directed RNA polymerase subunit RPC12/RpoP
MPTLNEWTSRWTSFRGKIEARLQAVTDEALAAYAQIAAASPLEHAPVAALEGAVQARYNGLGTKLDQAFETIDAGIDALIDATDSTSGIERLSQARDRVAAERRALAVRIDREEQVCKVRGAAVVARAIEPLARAEDPTQSCVQCGAPFDPGPVVQSTSVPCPHCAARLTVGPRPAMLQWYSRGVSALAEEAALPAWLAYRDAHDRYDALRRPTASDLQAVERAYEAYHRAVFGVLVARHPAWDVAEAERQIGGRVAQLRTMETRFQPTL